MLGSDTLQTRAANAGQIWEAKQRARHEVADAFDTIDNPDRVPIRRRRREQGGGFGPAPEFLEYAEPREAAHQLDAAYPRQDLRPQDVEQTDQGWRANETVRRQSAAYEFEDETSLDHVDPFGDLVAQDGGFGLGPGPQREIAAHSFEEQFPGADIGPEDVHQTDEGYELRESFIDSHRSLFF
jgi:hypothetical protein